LICEHASKVIPRGLGDLGLPEELLSSHIAWDPGALDLSLFLSRELDAFTVQRASRSFWRSLAGFSFQASGTLPALMSVFSTSVLRCFSAATIVRSARPSRDDRPW